MDGRVGTRVPRKEHSVSEKEKKEPQSGSKFSRRNLIGGAATGIVATALAGIVPAKKAEADNPPLFCPDSGFTIGGVCGGQNCFSTITIGGGQAQTLPFAGSGSLDKANQAPNNGAIPFRSKVLICVTPIGKVCVQLKSGGSSSANPGNASIGGTVRNTVTNAVLDQKYTFLGVNDVNGNPVVAEPAALNMNLNAGQSTDSSMKFEPDNSFPAGGVTLFTHPTQGEVKLTGYSMTVNARPKSGDTHLLTITNVSYASGQLDFKVTKHSSVGSITGTVHAWVHNPDDHGIPILREVNWSGGSLLSDNISVQLGTAQTSGVEVRIEVSAPEDTRKLFNYYIHTW